MRCGRSKVLLGASRGLAALALLSSFAAVEVHFAAHRPAASTDLIEPHDHRSQPLHVEARPSSFEPRCFVCSMSSQRRGLVRDLPAVLPRPLAHGVAAAGEYPVLARFAGRRPVSRGPPSLL